MANLDELEARVAAFEAKVAGMRAKGRYSARDEAIIAKWESDIEEARAEIAFQRACPGPWAGPGRPWTGGGAE